MADIEAAVLGGVLGDLVGELKKRLLRTPVTDLVDCFDNDKPLIGVNPYCYAVWTWMAPGNCPKLIHETDTLIHGCNLKEPFSKRVFAAHSESDATANITGIEDLQKVSAPDQFTFFASLKKQGYLT